MKTVHSRLSTICSLSLLLGAHAPAQGVPTWNQVPSENRPTVRDEYSWACDEARGHLVLFGGNLSYVRQGDTWVHDGVDWSLRIPVHFPSPRVGGAMAWDPIRSRILLFGGAERIGNLADTWEWDGVDWQLRTTASAPAPRYGACLAHDPVRQRMVLYGGMTDSGPVNDTWEWDGSTWVERTPVARPPAAIEWQDLAWDTVRQRGVLVGFWGSNRTCKVWEWDGANWVDRTPVVVPPPRLHSGLVFDRNLGRVVLHDGMAFPSSTNPRADLWAWDGTAWAALTPGRQATGVTGHELAWHPVWRSVVRFGGWHYPPGGGMSNPVRYDTLWMMSSFAHPPAATSFGVSCTSSAGTPKLEPLQMPWIGGVAQLKLSGVPASRPWILAIGLSSTNYWHLILPAQLSSFGMPNCWIYTDILDSYAMSTTTGSCRWSMTIPNVPALAGLQVFHQGYVNDPMRNEHGFVSTNAVSLVLGTTL